MRLADSAADDDSSLIAKAQAGDLGAFEGLYRQHSARVYALCLRLCGDREDAGELLQDVFVRVWQKLESFRGESAFPSWLHRLTVNSFLEHERSDRRRVARVLPISDLAWVERPVERFAEERMDLESAIAALPTGARAAFVLHEIEGYQHQEIAAQLGIAVGTVKAQLHRARKLLMEALDR